jgi:arsenate reductase
MKILFICWANVGRSQMGAAFYNHLTHSADADAAGTKVELPGETLQERRLRRGGTYVIDAMNEENIDISNRKMVQLTSNMLDSYDKIISMADKHYTPLWLSRHSKYEYWDVKDPGGKGLAETDIAKNDIKLKVEELVRHLGN